MSVHYKFKSDRSNDTIAFDGLHISVRDLKKAIFHQKKIGKSTDFDLQITNAHTNEVYTDDAALIPKNSSLIVSRIPLTAQQKKAWEKSAAAQLHLINLNKGDSPDHSLNNKYSKSADLTLANLSEEDKIQAAIDQSTHAYDPSHYVKIKHSNQVGEVPPNYRCFKCNQPGHWIKDCKLNNNQDASVEIRKSTGIPRSFMIPVEGPQVPGAMMTPMGHFAVPTIDHEARREPHKKPSEPFIIEKPSIPEDLVCGVCKDLLTDAVMIPCCGNSFCDECVRNVLLESEDNQCPDCKEKDVSPDTLIPSRFLRNCVNNFRNQTGYTRTLPPPPPPAPVQVQVQQPVQVQQQVPPAEVAPPGVQTVRPSVVPQTHVPPPGVVPHSIPPHNLAPMGHSTVGPNGPHAHAIPPLLPPHLQANMRLGVQPRVGAPPNSSQPPLRPAPPLTSHSLHHPPDKAKPQTQPVTIEVDGDDDDIRPGSPAGKSIPTISAPTIPIRNPSFIRHTNPNPPFLAHSVGVVPPGTANSHIGPHSAFTPSYRG